MEIQNLSPGLLQKYFEADKLGFLHEDLRGFVGVDEMFIPLAPVFRAATGMRSFEYSVSPDNVNSIVLFGDLLYEHVAPPTKERKVKKWLLWGEERVVRTTGFKRKLPVVEIMTIVDGEVDRGTTEESLSIRVKDTMETQLGSFEKDQYEPTNLLAHYISRDDFIQGLSDHEPLCKAAASYGLALAGGKQFDQVISGNRAPERNPLHTISFRESLDGVLGGIVSTVEAETYTIMDIHRKSQASLLNY